MPPDNTESQDTGQEEQRARLFFKEHCELRTKRVSSAMMLSATASCHRGWWNSCSQQMPDILRSGRMRFYSEYAATSLLEGSTMDSDE